MAIMEVLALLVIPKKLLRGDVGKKESLPSGTNKKYTQAPILVLQLVTQIGDLISTWKDYNSGMFGSFWQKIPIVVLSGTDWFFQVLHGSPVCDKLKLHKRCSEVLCVLKV